MIHTSNSHFADLYVFSLKAGIMYFLNLEVEGLSATFP